jgi:hypothetical protein
MIVIFVLLLQDVDGAVLPTDVYQDTCQPLLAQITVSMDGFSIMLNVNST